MLRRATRRLSPGRLAAVLGGTLLLLVIYSSSFVIDYGEIFRKHDPLVRSDVARLAPARVQRVDRVRELEQLRAVLREARQRRLKLSISGSRHSQGGHTYTPGGIVLDMRGFNRIRDIDPVGIVRGRGGAGGGQGVCGDGHVQGLETLKVASVFDPDGRFNPRLIDGTESVLDCDSVILAIGQELADSRDDLAAVQLDRRVPVLRHRSAGGSGLTSVRA